MALNQASKVEEELRALASQKDFCTIILLPHPLDVPDKTGETLKNVDGARYVLAVSPLIDSQSPVDPNLQLQIRKFSGDRPVGAMPPDGLLNVLRNKINQFPQPRAAAAVPTGK